MKAIAEYVITTNRRMEGVGLSKRGNWGGIRFPDDADAEVAARMDARGVEMTIEWERA